MVTVYPEGFELDHIVSLPDGGADTDENSQVLCVSRDAYGRKVGCHDAKTPQDGIQEPDVMVQHTVKLFL